MTRLKLTVAPFEGETTLSIISRLALRNGASFVQDFCADMGVSWRDVTNGDTGEISTLARLSGLSTDLLSARSVVQTNYPNYMINGHYLKSKTLVRRELRVCPRCLREDDEKGGIIALYGRLEWLIAAYRTCHIHRTPMLTLPDAQYPRCQHDFNQRVRDHWRTIIREEGGLKPCASPPLLDTYIASQVQGTDCTNHSTFLDLDLDLMCRLSEELGVVLVFGAAAYPSKLSSSELVQATEAGFRAISGGQDSLCAAFDAIKAASSSRAPGFQADFGVLSRRIERVDHCSPRYSGFIDQLTEFAFTHYPYGVGDMLFGRKCPKRYIHNLVSAAAAHGVTHTKMYRIAVGFGLGTDKQAERIEFPAAENDSRIAHYAACLSPKLATNYLGLRGAMLNRLVDAGLISARFDLPGTAPVYHPDDLNRLVDPLVEQAKLLDELPSQYVSIVGIGCNAKLRFEKVLKVALDGKLTSLCKLLREPKLDGLYVTLEDVRDQFEEPAVPGFTLEQIKRLLRINSSTVSWLIKQGFITSTKVRHHRHRRPVTLVSQQALQSFLKDYATLGMMAAVAHTQAKHVASKLEKACILPLQIESHLSKIYVRTPKLESLFDPGEISEFSM